MKKFQAIFLLYFAIIASLLADTSLQQIPQRIDNRSEAERIIEYQLENEELDHKAQHKKKYELLRARGLASGVFATKDGEKPEPVGRFGEGEGFINLNLNDEEERNKIIDLLIARKKENMKKKPKEREDTKEPEPSPTKPVANEILKKMEERIPYVKQYYNNLRGLKVPLPVYQSTPVDRPTPRPKIKDLASSLQLPTSAQEDLQNFQNNPEFQFFLNRTFDSKAESFLDEVDAAIDRRTSELESSEVVTADVRRGAAEEVIKGVLDDAINEKDREKFLPTLGVFKEFVDAIHLGNNTESSSQQGHLRSTARVDTDQFPRIVGVDGKKSNVVPGVSPGKNVEQGGYDPVQRAFVHRRARSDIDLAGNGTSEKSVGSESRSRSTRPRL